MIKEYLEKTLTDKQKELIKFSSITTQSMLRALDNSVLTKTYSIGLPVWADKDPQLVKDFTWLMHELVLSTTSIRTNYAEFKFNIGIFSVEEINAYRTKAKLDKFCMKLDTKTYPTNLVKRNGKIHMDGLNRPAMMKTAKNEFLLDTAMLTEYRRPIKLNLVKSIKKMIDKKQLDKTFFKDEASYLEIADMVIDHYIANPLARYNSECNVQDQRGRAIKKVLKRIGNYISNKDFRALLRAPKEYAIMLKPDMTTELNDIYYFIAELTGNKCIGGTEADKIEAGRQAYLNRELPRLALNSEEDRKELHELLWLTRIYRALDKLAKRGYVVWDIYLEIDHSMSLAQIVGALTNDKRVLESTCVIGDKLSDPWDINVRRPAAKAYGTPTLYGSSRSVVALIRKKNLSFLQLLLAENPNATLEQQDKARKLDKQEEVTIKKEFTAGRFSILKQFKDLLIQNYTVHEPEILINTGITQFKIHVNKFKQVSTRTVVTEAWNGKTFKHSFTHEPVMVPDYRGMATFWATCLVHHLDSDLMENVLSQFLDESIFDIHDAYLALPGVCLRLREAAAVKLKYYNTNRHIIVSNYMQSIGATSPKAMLQHMKLLASIVDADDQPFNRTCMK